MALKLTRQKVVMGAVLPVHNLGKKPRENKKYFAVKVENEDGKKEEWLLFTEKELNRSELNMGYLTDMLKPGRIHPHVVGSKKSFAVKLLFGNSPKTVLIGKSVLETARNRARRNPEDIPQQSRFLDMID